MSPGECLPEEVWQPGEAVVREGEGDEAGVQRGEAQLLPQLQQVAVQPQTGQPGVGVSGGRNVLYLSETVRVTTRAANDPSALNNHGEDTY